MDYGKALRIARAVAGIQQKDLATRSKLDSSYISLIEMGKRKPSMKTVRSLSAALGIPSDLFTLMASEEEDLTFADSSELEEVGKSLVKLLLPATFQKEDAKF